MNTDMINILHRALSVMIGLPFAFQLWTFILSTSYKRAAINMHSTNREIFRSIKLRYTNSAKLNIPLSDTDSFISKYFYGKGGPFRLVNHIERTSCILLCVTLLATTALYIRGLTDTTRMVAIIAASICFYIFRSALSTGKQMELTLSFTRDYLDNTLKHRVTPDNFRNRSIKSDTPISNETKNIAPNNSNTSNNNNNNMNSIIEEPANTNHNEIKDSDIATKIINISNAIENENSDIIEAVLQEFLA